MLTDAKIGDSQHTAHVIFAVLQFFMHYKEPDTFTVVNANVL